jgi:predicted dehydrogenase
MKRFPDTSAASKGRRVVRQAHHHSNHPSNHPERRRSIDIAIIGMGKWGNHLLLNALKIKGLNIRYICCRRESDVKSGVRIPIVYDEDEMLKDRRIRGVIIATQPEKHFSSVAKALRRNLKVFVEKPLTLSVKECDRLISIAGKGVDSGIMVGNKFLYSQAIRKLKDFIAKNKIEIQAISSRWLKGAGIQRCGIFFDIVYHHIYLADYFFGSQFDELRKFIINRTDGVVTSGAVILRYGRKTALIEASYNNHFDFYDHTIRLETDKGVFIITEKKRRLKVRFDNKGLSPLEFGYREKKETCVKEELKAFYEWLAAGKRIEFGPENDRRIIRYLA